MRWLATTLSWRINCTGRLWHCEDQVSGQAGRHHWTMNEWIGSAACRRFDAELFFPVGSGPASAHQAARAKAVCAYCPVAKECLAWALRNGKVHGIWGGLDTDERRALNRRRLHRQHRPSRTNRPSEAAPAGELRRTTGGAA